MAKRKTGRGLTHVGAGQGSGFLSTDAGGNATVVPFADALAPMNGIAGPGLSIDSEIVLFDGATGRLTKRATGSGLVLATLGVFSVTVFAQGVYTPALTSVLNLDASTAYPCQYIRVGSLVTVSGRVDVNPTAAGSVQLGIALPVPSNFAAVEQCAGAAASPTIAGLSAAILADITNDRAQLEFIAVDLTNQPLYFTFAYQVI